MHTGHRSRFVNRVLGNSPLYDHELLEILLYNVCPRIDLNACAHRLIDRFKDLKGVLNAEVCELVEVEGVGRNMAEYLKCLSLCVDRCSGSMNFGVLKTTAQFEKLITSSGREGEDSFSTYVLDPDGRIRRICTLSPEKATVHELLKLLSLSKAYGVFACFCRKGEATPTDSDGKLCNGLALACSSCGVRLYDFCLVGDGNKTFSYFVNGLLSGDR